MKLGTKLTLYLSIIIILVLCGYGYFDILSRRDILIRKMKAETRSTGRTLMVSLEKIFQPDEMGSIQGLINAVIQNEKTFGVIIYFNKGKTVFRSSTLGTDPGPFLDLILRSIQTDQSLETFVNYKSISLFSYTFPLKNGAGVDVGGVSILQHTYLMEEEIERVKWNIVITIFILISGTVTLVLLGTRKWVSRPISNLIEGVGHLAAGNLDHRVTIKKGDELSELGQAFNQMAVELKKARDQIIQEAGIKIELERSLRQSEKLATLGQLASGLAHEVGTPLNIISGRTELIKRKCDNHIEIQKNLDIILSQTSRITRIIQQLLGFVRKKKADQTNLAISPLLESTLDLLAHQIHKQNLRVVKNFQNPLPEIQGDPDQLQQVFLNLIINAIQSMSEGGILRLSVTSREVAKEGLENKRLYVEICIEDTGKGIEKEALQQIFTPFFTTKETGTGLGLMVSQGILQDHEGWIDVESAVGKGTVFKVYLPS